MVFFVVYMMKKTCAFRTYVLLCKQNICLRGVGDEFGDRCRDVPDEEIGDIERCGKI